MRLFLVDLLGRDTVEAKIFGDAMVSTIITIIIIIIIIVIIIIIIFIAKGDKVSPNSNNKGKSTSNNCDSLSQRLLCLRFHALCHGIILIITTTIIIVTIIIRTRQLSGN